MRKIILFLLLSFTTLMAQDQTAEQKSLLLLKQEVLTTTINKDLELSLPLQQEEKTAFKKKSAGIAILYSLLLPGMGELYAESYSSGKYFTIAEGALWTVYLGMNTYANWKKDKYKSFAQSNAGVDPAGKNDEFYSNISEYLNVQDYNNTKALERDFIAMYNEDKFHWSWSEEDRRSYRGMWVSSEQSFNNVRFVVGALLLNRLASAINAVRLVSAYNKNAAANMSWNVSAGIVNHANPSSGLVINLQTRF